MEDRKLVIKDQIKKALQEVGIIEGQHIMTHCSLSSMGFVCGGAQVVIEALLEAVGETGTIIMPTQTWKNLDPAYGVHWEEPEEWWQSIRDNWPGYDKEITPTNSMGAVAEMFRKWPGAIRSDHPVRSFAALGMQANYLMEHHSLENIFGEDSPLGKLYELDGYCLLMGVDHDKNTSLHLADVRANYPGKHQESNSCAMMIDGKRQWITYETLFVDGEDFIEIGKSYEETHKVRKVELGNATIQFIRVRDIVDYAIEWIEQNRKELAQ